MQNLDYESEHTDVTTRGALPSHPCLTPVTALYDCMQTTITPTQTPDTSPTHIGLSTKQAQVLDVLIKNTGKTINYTAIGTAVKVSRTAARSACDQLVKKGYMSKPITVRDGVTALDIADELRSIANQRPDIAKPVWHCSLSAAPGERYSDERWNEITQDFMKGLGYDLSKTGYIIIRHNDKPHDHNIKL